MAKYENEYSKFPNEKIKLHKFKNVDDNVGGLINQINTLRSQGMYGQAQVVINEHPELISYIADATTINTLIEEIYNAQAYAQHIGTAQQIVRFDENEPEEYDTSDVWISPYI